VSDEQILPADDREIRASLGLESAFGYHIERRTSWSGEPRYQDVLAALEAARAPDAPTADPAMARRQAPARRASRRTPSYPCIKGVRYTGCIGETCPLQTCWTGAPTPAALARRHARWVGAASYVGDALCQHCRHVAADLTPPGGDASPATAAAQESPEGCAEGTPQTSAEAAPCAITRGPSQKVTQGLLICARGQWRHAVSRSDFASRRIPIKDDVDAAACPAFEDAGALHPDVVAYRARHRQDMRDFRERMKRHKEETESDD
jgi:hypothetical protein